MNAKYTPAGLRLGIDIGATTVKIGAVGEGSAILARAVAPTLPDFNAAADLIAKTVREMFRDAGLDLSALPFAGAGIPSAVHPGTGRVVEANNAGWHNAPLKEALEQRLGLPVLVANDADCALAAEASAGAARGIPDALMLTLGTGVGGALLLGGRLYRGADGMGMELGHLPLIAGGRPCTCGADGCLEAYCSATGLVALTRDEMDRQPDSMMHAWARRRGGRVSGRTSFECLARGDKAAEAVVDRYCALLAQGIGGLVNAFRPRRVLVGGGVSHAGIPLFSRLNALLPRFVISSGVIGAPDIVPARMGNDAGIIGAATLDQVRGG